MSNYWIKCPLDIKEKVQQYLKYNLIKEFGDIMYEHNNERYGEGYCTKCFVKFNRFQPFEYKEGPYTSGEHVHKKNRKHYEFYEFICRDCKFQEQLEKCKYEEDVQELMEDFREEFHYWRESNLDDVYPEYLEEYNKVEKYGEPCKKYPPLDQTTYSIQGESYDPDDTVNYKKYIHNDGTAHYWLTNTYFENQRKESEKYIRYTHNI